MRLLTIPLLLCIAAGPPADKKDGAAAKPKITVGKETTRVTGPLDKEGFVDYVTALNERLSKGVTPKNNANVMLWKSFGPKPEGAAMPAAFWKWMKIDPLPEKGEYFIWMHHYFKKHAAIDPTKDINTVFDNMDKAHAQFWKSKDFPIIAGWLTVNEKTLDMVVEATKLPEYYSPLVPSDRGAGPGGLVTALLPGVQKCREYANALTIRAMLRAGEGRLDDAWQDLLAVHRLGRLIGRGGTLIEALVGIAIEHIAAGCDLTLLEDAKLDRKKIEKCRRDLEALPAMPGMADKLNITERLIYLDIVTNAARHGTKGLDEIFPGGLGIPADFDVSAFTKDLDWDIVLKRGNQWFDRVTAALAKERPERQKEIEAVEKELKDLKATITVEAAVKLFKETPQKRGKFVGDLAVVMLLPATTKVIMAGDRCEQTQRNERLAFALAAYKSDNGSYPKTLDALAPKYLAKVPGDFFTGKALTYRPREDGYLFYSFGPNGKDDGGRFYDDDPPGDDPNVRMPRKKR